MVVIKKVSFAIFTIVFWVMFIGSYFTTSEPPDESYTLTQQDYEEGYDYYINGIDPDIDQSQQYGGR
ncbi:hypothetical protein [Paenibacillus prosopidis]|uniref:Uncharacterized protein n=1 Tax=Paenibacillus prosopidis TaxID=630520 RepID=A0A368VXD3_9BACL|nr:hypothetical protein [Paenibacillus prosopidis]RCW44212.1 hypothetical protein DFP97_11276 [Paenibacillus prosopidis]